MDVWHLLQHSGHFDNPGHVLPGAPALRERDVLLDLVLGDLWGFFLNTMIKQSKRKRIGQPGLHGG